MKLTRNNWLIIFFLIGITTLAAYLRFISLSNSFLWQDEAWSYFSSQMPWLAAAFSDVHPPLNTWLIKIAVFFFGNSESVIRSISFIFGTLSVPLVYFFGKEVTGKEFPGIVAAILLCISVEAIMQSDMARMYPLIIFLFMLFVIFFLRAYKDPSYKNWLAVTILAILMSWTYYLLILIIALTILWFMIKERKKILTNKPFLWGAIFYVISLVFLSLPFLRAMTLKGTEGSTIIYSGFGLVYEIIITLMGSPPLLAVCITLFAVGGAILLFRDNATIAGYLILLVIGYIGVCVALGNQIMMLPRYFDVLLPILLSFIGFALYSIPVYFGKNWKSYFMTGFILLVLIVSFSLTLPDYLSTPHNWSGDIPSQDAQLLNMTPGAQEIVILVNPGTITLLRYYWKGTANIDMFNSFSEGVNLTSKYNISYVLIPSDPVPITNVEGHKITEWLNSSGVYSGDYRGMDVYKVTYL